MHSQIDQREHIRQISIVAYVIMLALLVPLTIFLVKQENHIRSQAAGKVVTPTSITLTPTIDSNM